MGREGADGAGDAETDASGSGSDGPVDSSGGRPLSFVRDQYVAKLVVALLLVVLFVSTAGAVSYVQTYTHISAEATEELETRTERRAASVSEWRATHERDVRQVSAADVYGAGPDAIDQHLRDAVARTTGPVVALHYVEPTASGPRVVASTASTPNRTVAARHGAWRGLVDRVTADGTAPSTVAVSGTAHERDGSMVLCFVSPVQHATGALVLVASVSDQRRLLRFSERNATTAVLNASGARVFATADESVDLPVDESMVQTARSGVTSTADRGDDVLAYAPVASSPWVAVTAVDRSTLYHSARALRQSIAMLVGTALLSLALVGVVFGRQTVRPLVELRNRTRAMERGDLDVDLETDRGDEIGRLFDSLSSMRDALREQIREAERARRRAERSNRELERHNERLDQFASTVSHDLRNPLSVARGRVALLESDLERLAPEDEAALRAHVSKIEQAHERMDAIIGDVLTLAREGSSVEDPSPVSLAAAAEEAWASIDDAAATLTVAADRTIVADRSRLLRVLENLFRNAIDHVGSDVAVEVGDVDGGFYVADDGPGIPDEEVDDVFEYGYTTTDEGTGIGLSVVQTIAEAHGWRLFVDTTYEDGAMFVFADVDSGVDAATDPDGARLEWNETPEE